jgi:hypothetical protein
MTASIEFEQRRTYVDAVEEILSRNNVFDDRLIRGGFKDTVEARSARLALAGDIVDYFLS